MIRSVGRVRGDPAADRFAVAQHGEAVADFADFFEEVRDVDDRDAPLAEPANEREESIDVTAREAARRFVEHEHAAFERDGAGDFDQLLLGQR